tara:strand:- start:2948 stop:3577 length:630 start_codon:yes stop_codon:yes gene_type:complete
MDTEKILYIDFEGNTSGHLYLVGYSFDGNFHQVVLDKDLKGLADHHGFKAMSLEEFADDISKIIKSESITAIAGYTSHDIEILRKHKPFKDCMKHLAVAELDVHKVARSFIRKNHLKKFRDMVKSLPTNYHRKRYSLINVMLLIEGKVPQDYGIGKTTSRLNAARDSLILREQDYSRLTTTQKGKATKALKHNKYDVNSLEKILRFSQI